MRARFSFELQALFLVRLFIIVWLVLCDCDAIAVNTTAAVKPPLILNTFAGPPLSTPDQTGMYDRIIQEAFDRIGVDIEIDHLPAERSIANANAGIDDGEFVRISGLSTIYPNLIQVPEKITDFVFVAFTKNVNVPTTDWLSLNPFHVGIVRGWKILEKNLTHSKSLVTVKNQNLLFTILEKERVEVVVYSRLEGYWVINQLGLQNIKELTPPLAEREMFLYLNKKHFSHVPRIAQALRKMKKDGTYQRIVNYTLQSLPQIRKNEYADERN